MKSTRRRFLHGIAAAAMLPDRVMSQPASRPPCAIRTITAGVDLARLGDLDSITRAIATLKSAKETFETAGFVVQTLRLALTPIVAATDPAGRSALLASLRALDSIAADAGALLSIGPVLTDDRLDPTLAGWVAELLQST